VFKVHVPPAHTSCASTRSVDFNTLPRPCVPAVLFDYRELGTAAFKGLTESVLACQFPYSEAAIEFNVFVFLSVLHGAHRRTLVREAVVEALGSSVNEVSLARTTSGWTSSSRCLNILAMPNTARPKVPYHRGVETILTFLR